MQTQCKRKIIASFNLIFVTVKKEVCEYGCGLGHFNLHTLFKVSIGQCLVGPPSALYCWSSL